LFDYHLFLRLCPKLISKDLILLLENYAENIKPKLYSEDFEGIQKVKHFCYVVSNLFTFKTYEDTDKTLTQLTDICTEFCYLPNPYGEMANRMCEILDNETFFPTITKLKRLIEDFPKIIEYERKGQNKSLAIYQNVFVYESKNSSLSDKIDRSGNIQTVNLLKYLKSCHTVELLAKDLNQYRYTFIYKLVKLNKKQKSMTNFMAFLKTLPSSYVWQLFKQVLEIVSMVENFEENNISGEIAMQLERLAEDSIQNIVVPSTELSKNSTNYGYPKFKINFASDFVTQSSTNTYVFNQETNYSEKDIETSTMKR
jgi:hypothetical protein